ncbi:SDR family oxidoreductase [Methylonatrum kenyense]|uniref:SDR family oxidoreductase n=1 Tax=Methylonatrum kenyense TaxID=455253 RepID=UPI0020BE4DFD|nr:SDR family oxidoreductase [Methylonatrum kenyense]MCK8515031.1 SDR family oxidoreductase [Methylonatrum kenyense]
MNPVLLITGGGRGIGAATARLAASRGYAVCVNYRVDAESANRLVQEIVEAGGQAVAAQADVSSEVSVRRLFDVCEQALGPLSALVNNAGVIDRIRRVENMTEARLQRMFATNVTSAFLCAGAAIRRLSTRHGGPGGAIVNVSSGAARHGSAHEYVDYAASKAALEALTRGLALEVAEEGIRVNTVRPGFIDTDLHNASGVADRRQQVRERIPVGRLGMPEEVAEAILWLLSDAASYVSGASLDVAGGR